MTRKSRATTSAPVWRAWALAALLVVATACGAPEQQSEGAVERAQELLAAAKTADKAAADPRAPKPSSDDGSVSTASVDDLAGEAKAATQGAKDDRPGTVKGGAAGGTGATAEQSGTPAAKGAQPSVQQPPAGTMEFDATLEPTCVRPGGTVTITVVTQPQAGVGYHAIYADGKGGAVPPYGAGYGGNDGDLADATGRYTDTWTVSPKAPTGDGHVEVVVGSGGAMGQGHVPFSVADAVTGECAP